ncbi:MAG: metallophosphoesterase [Clostridiales bacterium]|nr:metallophosphoesterase [Clostridiales bacterium]
MEQEKLKLSRFLFEAGANSPFKLLLASDTHLTRADIRDDERKRCLAQRRAEVFPYAESELREIGEISRREGCPIAYAGDLIDFVSWANLDAAKCFCAENDVIMAAGNHEFSQYVGEAFEDKAYRDQSLAKVQAVFKNDIRLSARVINGVKLIALDNGYYLFEEEQLAFLKREALDGLPMILLIHTPLYSPLLHEFMLSERRQPCGYLCGTPESEMGTYPPERRRQQLPDGCTEETLRFIGECKQIKLILTGHIHAGVSCRYAGRIPQVCTGLHETALVTIG